MHYYWYCYYCMSRFEVLVFLCDLFLPDPNSNECVMYGRVLVSVYTCPKSRHGVKDYSYTTLRYIYDFSLAWCSMRTLWHFFETHIFNFRKRNIVVNDKSYAFQPTQQFVGIINFLWINNNFEKRKLSTKFHRFYQHQCNPTLKFKKIC